MTKRTRQAEKQLDSPTLAVSTERYLLQLTDGLVVSLAGSTLSVPNRRARALLAYLAVEPDGAVPRERLAGLLWPDVAERHARASLRQTLFDLRAALGPACEALLVMDRDTIALRRGAFDVDLALARTAIENGTVPDPLLRPRYADRLLAGFDDISPLYGAWLVDFRRTTEHRLRWAMEQSYNNPGQRPAARRRLAQACLELDPTDEAACRAVMRLSAEAGETSVALRAYATLYEVLETEHDTEPSAATQALVADIKRGILDRGKTSPAEEPRAARVETFFGSVPVVAVLPFRTLGPAPVPPYVVEGLMEDVVCVLASLREPVALSSCSTRIVRDDGIDINRACQRLGAQYFVTGSIRMYTTHARISVELADVGSGAVVWGQIYDVGNNEIFDTQGMIAARVAQTLAPQVRDAELRRSRRCRFEDLNAYQLLLQARDLTYRMDPDTYDDALPLLRRAVTLDSGFAGLYAGLANWYCLRIFQGWSPDRNVDTEAVLTNARAALQTDPGHPRMLALLGHTRMLTARRYDEALAMHRRALDSSPNDSEAWMFSSATFAYLGDGEEAVRRAERALALSPCDPLLHQYEHYCCIANYSAGDYAAAAKYGLRSFERNPNLVSNLRMTAAALAGLGRHREARDLAAHVLRLEPGFAVTPWIQQQAFRDPAQRARYGVHLVEAGLPP